MTATTLSLPDGRSGYLFTFQDVTDVRRLERGARMQQRLAAVGEMAAGIAHEIRNPLASMSGSIQVLRQELPLSEEQAQLMDIVLRESERLNETIRSFLAYARPQRFTLTRLDVRRVVQDTAMLLRNSADVRDDHVVDVDLPADPVWYEADENQIRQILWNLATNGLRAMPSGGRLLLSAKTEREGGQDELSITIQDQGCGIPAADLDSLFQPFRSSFEKGTGLGLAIVHRIVTDYNGSIQVSSTVGTGTTVRVRLPIRASAAASAIDHPGCGTRRQRAGMSAPSSTHPKAPAPDASSGPPAAPAKVRILVVDDEPSMREMLRIVLRRDGYEVTIAENGRDAIEQLRRSQFDLAPLGHQDARYHRRRGAARREGNQSRHRGVHDDGVRLDRAPPSRRCASARSTTSRSRSAWTSSG